MYAALIIRHTVRVIKAGIRTLMRHFGFSGCCVTQVILLATEQLATLQPNGLSGAHSWAQLSSESVVVFWYRVQFASL